MLTRLDHPIVAVRDLDEAVAVYERLGFEVMRGGRNPGLGTCNALIRFGLDYLELLSVEDRAATLTHHPRGRELLAFLDTQAGGLLSFVVASNALDADLARAAAHGFAEPGEPIAMQRVRPDGVELHWRLVIPGRQAFRQAWPLLIEWQTPDAERLRWEPPAQHPNGARGVVGLALRVRSLAGAVTLYRAQLGVPVEEGEQRATARLPGCPIELFEATDGDEGLCLVRLGVQSLAQTRRLIGERGVPAAGGLSVLAAGARLVFEELAA